MLETYFDESAPGRRSDESLLVIAGYIGDEANWIAFSARWKEVLSRFQLRGFHMKEIRNFRHPMFRHLSASQRRDLLVELIEAVTDAALLGSLTYLRPAEYEAVASPDFRSRFGSAYGLSVGLNLLQISEHLSTRPDFPQRTRVFVEQGHANAGDALRAIEHWKFDTEPAPTRVDEIDVTVIEADPLRTSRLRIAESGLGSKESMYPLHASDMLAYLAHSSLTFKIDDFLRGLFDELLPRIPHLSTGWNKAALQQIVELGEAKQQENASVRAELNDLRSYLYDHNLKMRILPWGYTIDGRHLSDEQWERARSAIRQEFARQKPRD